MVAGAAPAPARSFPAPRLSRLSLFGSRRRLSREPAGTSAREDARCSSVGPGGPRMVPARPPEWLSGLELESRVSAAPQKFLKGLDHLTHVSLLKISSTYLKSDPHNQISDYTLVLWFANFAFCCLCFTFPSL